MKTKLLLLLLISISFVPARASHIMGGEITWDCLGNGQYRFHMKFYRDCNGIPGPQSLSLTVTNHPTVNTIPMTLVSQIDDSPVCTCPGPHITCANPGGQPGAVEEFVFQSAPVTLSGVPPAAGWIFWYDDCCRNAAISNLANSGDGFTFRAIMHAYSGTNTNPCFDSSPHFYEKPRTIICTGYPFTFNHNAIDNDLDSLVYDFAQPLSGTSGPSSPACVFASGYSYTSPLPGPTQNPQNVAAVLDPHTGEIKYTSYTSGSFVMVIRVRAYKCQQLVAEIFRDLQVVLFNCAQIAPGVPNHPPAVTAPFPDSLGNYTQYVDTVFAGELVSFYMSATDTDVYASGQYQDVSMSATGSQFDINYTNPNGTCLHPPCATLTPPPSQLSAIYGVSTTFNWQTTCEHLGFNIGCNNYNNIYNFVIKSQDCFCPMPGITVSTITVVVLPPPPLPPPHIRCASVGLNGDVSLNWDQPHDTVNTFHSYDIYNSQNQNGPYVLIDSVLSYNQLNYTHAGANGNTQDNYYYIIVRSNCSSYNASSINSDTIRTMMMTVTNSGNGFAQLNWNSLHTPPIPTNTTWYKVYREYPAGVWTYAGTTQSLTFQDPITLCNATINYRVSIDDSSGCTSFSSFDGDLFHDIIVPADVTIDSVTVNSSGNASLSWFADSSGDTKGYIIYQSVAGLWTPVDTVYGINNLSLTTNINASLQSDSFRLAAFDSCWNTSPLGIIHNTIHLKATLQKCDHLIELKWNPYINWASGVAGYDIYASENGLAFVKIGLVGGGTLQYTHTGLHQYSTYCYFVVATSNDALHVQTSTSSSVCVYADIPQVPLFEYIKHVTVSGINEVSLEAFVDTAADVNSYKVMRAEEKTGTYVLVGTVSSTGNPFISYIDNTALTVERSYYYKIIAVDICGAEVFTSEIARTIHTLAIANEDLSNTVSWNDYEIWLGNVDHYNIYRAVDGVPGLLPIASALPGTNFYVDQISDLGTNILGHFCYYVQALEGPGNTYGFTDTSRSNDICVDQSPTLFVPNAFTPSGRNPVFIPYFTFINVNFYNMYVFNRWGEKVFYTNDPQKGWDGTFNGSAAPQGIYVYMIDIRGTDGSSVKKQGTVTLIPGK